MMMRQHRTHMLPHLIHPLLLFFFLLFDNTVCNPHAVSSVPFSFNDAVCNSVRGTPKISTTPQCSAAPPSLHSAKPLLCSALCIQLHWFVHTSPPPAHRTLRTLLFMVPPLFIIIVSRHSAHHSACPRAFLYMYLHQHGIPILFSSDPLLVALIM